MNEITILNLISENLDQLNWVREGTSKYLTEVDGIKLYVVYTEVNCSYSITIDNVSITDNLVVRDIYAKVAALYRKQAFEKFSNSLKKLVSCSTNGKQL